MSYLLHFVDHRSCSWYEIFPTWLFILTRFCFLRIWHRKLTRIISPSKSGNNSFRMGLGTVSYYFSKTNFRKNQRTSKVNFFFALCRFLFCFRGFFIFQFKKINWEILIRFSSCKVQFVRLQIILLNQNWHIYIILDKNHFWFQK